MCVYAANKQVGQCMYVNTHTGTLYLVPHAKLSAAGSISFGRSSRRKVGGRDLKNASISTFKLFFISAVWKSERMCGGLMKYHKHVRTEKQETRQKEKVIKKISSVFEGGSLKCKYLLFMRVRCVLVLD